jgi:hypothetical protein
MIEIEKINSELLQLPSASRAWLAKNLIESLEQETDPDAEELWAAEIHRRYREVKSGRAVTKPASIVLKKIRESLATSHIKR